MGRGIESATVGSGESELHPSNSTPVPGSHDDGDDPEDVEQRKELLVNADTWYSSLELLLCPKLRWYKIPYIPSITEFITSVGVWLEGAVKEESL